MTLAFTMRGMMRAVQLAVSHIYASLLSLILLFQIVTQTRNYKQNIYFSPLIYRYAYSIVGTAIYHHIKHLPEGSGLMWDESHFLLR